LEELSLNGWIQPQERVVIFNTGAAQKYPEAMKAELPQLNKSSIDWQLIERSGH
jgi:threonine synthase